MIAFNEGSWADHIQSQEALFDPAALLPLADRFRREFADSPLPDLPTLYPHIPQSAIRPALYEVAQQVCGYDMPVLLTASDVKPERTIMLCAQDPLRKGYPHTGISVACPFGVSVRKVRETRKSHGLVWAIVQALVGRGDAVWLTDARKLWTSKGLPGPVRDLMRDTLHAEVASVRPDRIVAFGTEAQGALSRFDVDSLRVPHPAHYHDKSWYFDGITQPEDTLDGRFAAKVARYLREIGQTL